MNHNVEFKGFGAEQSAESQKQIRRLIDRLIAGVDKKAKGFSPVFLKLLVEETSAHKLYKVSATLDLPGKTLAAKTETHDVIAAIRDAFTEIQRQLEDQKATLRGEHLWKRLAKRKEIRKKKAQALPSEDNGRESFFSLVKPHLNQLTDFVGREVAYAEATGDLVPDELSAQDVLDAALIRAYGDFAKDPSRGEIRSWLIRLATEQLETEIRRLKSERKRSVHIEEHVPETPPAEAVSTLGDEILDFYQPDQYLKLEDVIPDIEVPTPEQETEAKELRQCVNTALTTMSTESRRALLLRYVEGLTGAALAKAMGTTEPEIARRLEAGRAYLRQKLIESGCGFKQTESRTKSDPGVSELTQTTRVG